MVLKNDRLVAGLRIGIGVLAFLSLSCVGRKTGGTKSFPAVVREVYPHDVSSFTEGLFFEGGSLYEGLGLEGKSMVKEVEITWGLERKRGRPLAEEFFGEGIALFSGELFQLTWHSNKVFVYDFASLSLKREVPYPHEGWGLTTIGDRLVASDGTATLRFLDPKNLVQAASVEVHEGGEPLTMINELETVEGKILANVWMENRIVIINPASGLVEAEIDATDLRDRAAKAAGITGQHLSRNDCLNGIAYDASRRRLFVTGKFWPVLFALDLPPGL